MSGSFDDERPRWPEQDFDHRASDPDPGPSDPAWDDEGAPDSPGDAVPTEAAEPSTTFGDGTAQPDPPPEDQPDSDGWDVRRDGDRRRPTTAEQAVPWLIGLLLALTGIVVVLMALIFIGPQGVASEPTPTPVPSLGPTATPLVILTPSPSPSVGPTATPPPVFGALEMTYLGRASASSPIRVLRRDFSTANDPAVLLDDPSGVSDYAWSPDGLSGAAIVSGRALALVAGQEPRTLTDPVKAIIFADDSTTLYGLRISADGSNDRAELLKIDFATGSTQIIATMTYPHPTIIADPALKEAQFADNGGIVRLYTTIDGNVVAWILGAPATYRIDPESGTVTEVDHQPTLWSPDQRVRIGVTEKSGVSTITATNSDDVAEASVKVTGLVSHIRWAGSSNEIVFTLGRIVGSGVHQDLYVWDLVDGKDPSPLTSNGASFGAEWLGVLQVWTP